VILALALAVGGAAGFAYLFLRAPAPAPVGLVTVAPSDTAAASQPLPASSAGSGAFDPAVTAPSGGLEGTWSVDTSIGTLDDGSGSFVGYRVQEELANVGAATAVGRTQAVTGSLTLDGTTLTAVEVTADLSTLRSDNDMRDGQLQRQALETGAFPTATFVLTEPIELGSPPAEGDVVEATAAGELTLHGQTRPIELPIDARLADGVMTVAGSIDIAFADYGIAQPQSMMVLSIDDHGTMELQLHFTKT
jgi:polyisoprenoid-binding protein YceI